MDIIRLVVGIVAPAIFAALVEYLLRSILPEKRTRLVIAITITACLVLIAIVIWTIIEDNRPSSTGQLPIRSGSYEAETLDEQVAINHILCIMTGPIVVDLTQDVVFQGGTEGELKGTVVCWIGEQRASAQELQGGQLVLWRVSGDVEQRASELVRKHEQELKEVGCGDVGPCTVVEHLIVRPDGTTFDLSPDQQ